MKFASMFSSSRSVIFNIHVCVIKLEVCENDFLLIPNVNVLDIVCINFNFGDMLIYYDQKQWSRDGLISRNMLSKSHNTCTMIRHHKIT